MHFGNSPRTAETERRMTAWRQAHPDATTAEYNRAYETMWNSPERYSDKEVHPPYETTASDETLVVTIVNKERLRGREEQALYGSTRPPRHRKQATKGAFGKKR